MATGKDPGFDAHQSNMRIKVMVTVDPPLLPIYTYMLLQSHFTFTLEPNIYGKCLLQPYHLHSHPLVTGIYRMNYLC